MFLIKLRGDPAPDNGCMLWLSLDFEGWWEEGLVQPPQHVPTLQAGEAPPPAHAHVQL